MRSARRCGYINSGRLVGGGGGGLFRLCWRSLDFATLRPWIADLAVAGVTLLSRLALRGGGG